MAGISAVLFDFGGVFTVSPFTAAKSAGRDLGIDAPLALELCFGPYHEDTDHPWHRLERGEVSLEDARVELVELARSQGVTVDPFTLLSGLNGEDSQRAEVVTRAARVRESGVRTALVTNNVAEFGDAWKAMVPVDEIFEIVVDSSKEGVRKPNPAMFKRALDALDALPQDAVLLDDHPANVASAESLGVRGVVVSDDRIAAFDELDRLLTMNLN